MTTLNNIEKLIQIATIEQMYGMLQKMKQDACLNTEPINKSNNEFNTDTTVQNLSYLVEELNQQNTTTSVHIKELYAKIDEHSSTNCNIKNDLDEFKSTVTNIIDKLTKTIESYSIKINSLEYELQEFKSNTSINTQLLCANVRGQQLLTSYPGYSKETKCNVNLEQNLSQEHIVLKIEEKLTSDKIQECICENLPERSINEYIDSDNEDDFNPALVTCSVIELNNEVVEESEEEEVESEEEEVESEEEELVEEEEVESEEEEVVVEEEEEVVVEEEEELVEEEEVESEVEVEVESEEEEVVVDEEEEVVVDEEEEVVVEEEEELVEEVVEEEEDEEVFEIEIDDITYFATSDENGILYEVTKDGDVGNKVGIIKDGEPIFN
jgi:hypothetical protein